MGLGARSSGKSKREAEPARFEHSSRHADLSALIADHMLDPHGPTATTHWVPSRRGNSPRVARRIAKDPEPKRDEQHVREAS
jgi:hypothetical protein